MPHSSTDTSNAEVPGFLAIATFSIPNSQRPWTAIHLSFSTKVSLCQAGNIQIFYLPDLILRVSFPLTFICLPVK
jgi:hypothetical protein